VTAFLFTFEDQNTGELADTIAPNEAAARLQLGGDWVDVERAPLWAPPSEIGDMAKIIQQAQDEERAAHAAAQAANPMGKGRFTTPEALKKFSDAEAAHAKALARVRALLKLSASTG
jgi:hypothetical protein